MILVFGMIDFGGAINRYAAVSNATREGARVASLGGSILEIRTAVDDALGDIGLVDATTTVTCLTPGGSAACNYQAGAIRGGTAIVQVNWTATGSPHSPRPSPPR